MRTEKLSKEYYENGQEKMLYQEHSKTASPSSLQSRR